MILSNAHISLCCLALSATAQNTNVALKQIRLLATGKCLYVPPIPISKNEDGTVNVRDPNAKSDVLLKSCNNFARSEWTVTFDGPAVLGDTKSGLNLDAGDANKEGIVVEGRDPDDPRPGQVWDVRNKGRISVFTDTDTEPKYCLSQVEDTSSSGNEHYIKLAECNEIPLEKEGNIKQMWEFIEPVTPTVGKVPESTH